MSDLYKNLRNLVLSTTGCKVNNHAISLILALQAARQEPTSGEAVAVCDECGYSYGPTSCKCKKHIAAHPPAKVPEGYALVPESMCLSYEDIESIITMTGWDEGRDDFGEGVLWVGTLKDDDGNETYGLHISCIEVMEEGALPVQEFQKPALTTPTPATTPETEWVIQLRGEYLVTRGIWERPDHRGYTNDLHEAGRYSEDEAKKAQEMAPDKYKAVCLSATTPQPADKWIRLSDSEPDFDEAGNAWLCRWVEHLEAWEVDLETYNDVFAGLSGRVREVFVGAYWMPTGLKRPAPPQEQ